MGSSYKVHFWAIRQRTGRRKPYEVRWQVNSREKSESFTTKGLAESRRSELMQAARRGEPFDEETGLPASELRAQLQSITWYQHTRDFIEKRWEGAPAKSRRNFADALATITPALVKSEAGRPDSRVLRRALYSWAYNKSAWDQAPQPDWHKALDWLERNSVSIVDLEDPQILRKALDALGKKLDGKPAAARTALRKRACLSDALGMAAEAKYFTTAVNPLQSVQWTAPRTAEEVNPETVANPRQVRRLLTAVRDQGDRGERLEAFFSCLYYAGMRPAEVIHLQKSQCCLPDKGWGTLTLRGGMVRAGQSWTDDGSAHEQRSLKWRAPEDSRPVPIPPAFVRLLRSHIEQFGTAPDGRLFRTNRNGLVQESGYGEVWAKARATALTPEEVATALARRPYDLRHAGISFWLSSGVDPAEVARRAGHSLPVLFRVYAKVLAQSQDRANQRIDAALKEWAEPHEL
ncbi:tyrosine-type recombinase/integrase [Streptomyces cylindrosporus]|uniref:Tyrosine-type recombinase/integrase n=1 Tax=Streptomyces cylindrosporus TaxID=2927583 RepID=A0ABS9YGA4_9ACTN|nr:tyrosine-type recombinase/integrase [Streptomyces cylindrosporus]MCI3276263.1 tyrosine-type recombinase/integrase [Streptomyces cylindrosporus]